MPVKTINTPDGSRWEQDARGRWTKVSGPPTIPAGEPFGQGPLLPERMQQAPAPQAPSFVEQVLGTPTEAMRAFHESLVGLGESGAGTAAVLAGRVRQVAGATPKPDFKLLHPTSSPQDPSLYQDTPPRQLRPPSPRERGALKLAGEFGQARERFAADQPSELQTPLHQNLGKLRDPRTWVGGTIHAGVSMLPSLALAGAATAIGGPLAGAAVGGFVGGLQEGFDEYKKAIEAGENPDEAFRRMMEMAAGSAVLNAISFGNILSKLGGKALVNTTFKTILNFVESGAVETITEVAEGPLAEAIQKRDKTTIKGLLKAILEELDVAPGTLVTGGLGGAIAGSISSKREAAAPEVEDWEIAPLPSKKAKAVPKTTGASLETVNATLDNLEAAYQSLLKQDPRLEGDKPSVKDLKVWAKKVHVVEKAIDTWNAKKVELSPVKTWPQVKEPEPVPESLLDKRILELDAEVAHNEDILREAEAKRRPLRAKLARESLEKAKASRSELLGAKQAKPVAKQAEPTKPAKPAKPAELTKVEEPAEEKPDRVAELQAQVMAAYTPGGSIAAGHIEGLLKEAKAKPSPDKQLVAKLEGALANYKKSKTPASRVRDEQMAKALYAGGEEYGHVKRAKERIDTTQQNSSVLAKTKGWKQDHRPGDLVMSPSGPGEVVELGLLENNERDYIVRVGGVATLYKNSELGALPRAEGTTEARLAEAEANYAKEVSRLDSQIEFTSAGFVDNVLTQWIMSPEYAATLVEDPEMKKTMLDLTGSILNANAEVDAKVIADKEYAKQIHKTLTKEERVLVRRAMKTIYSGDREKMGRLHDQRPAVFAAANSLIGYFERMRSVFVEYKLDQYARHISQEAANAMIWADVGEKISNIAKGINMDPKELQDLYDEYKAIYEWGLDDYITNIEMGTYRMVDSNGVVRAVGVTLKDAIKKGAALLSENPSMSLKAEVGFGGSPELAIDMKPSAYFALRRRVEKQLKEHIDKLDEEVRKKVKKETGIVLRQAFKPGATYAFAGPAQPRRDILKGEENIFDVLPGYSHAMWRKVIMDPVIDKVREGVQILPENLQDLVLSQLEYAKGKYSFGDQLADMITQRLGARPALWSKTSRGIRSFGANTKLGYKVSTAYVNLVSGLGHIYVKTGLKYIKEAHEWVQTAEGSRFALEEEPYMHMSFVIDTGGHIKTGLSWLAPLKLFQLSEPMMRKTALAANYLFAKGEFGMSDMEARLFTRRGMRFQLFTYNAAALPRLLRSPGGKLFGQFRTFFVKELEFMHSLSKKRSEHHGGAPEILRYIALQLALAGPRGAIYMARSIPILMVLTLLDDVEEWMNKHMPRTSRGLTGLLAGGDVTAPAVMQFPGKLIDYAGWFVSDIVDLTNDVIMPWIGGEGSIDRAAIKWIRDLAAITYYLDQVYDSIIDRDGWVMGGESYGRLYQVSGWWDRALLAAGITPLKSSQQKVVQGILDRGFEKKNNTTNRVRSEFAERVYRGQPIPESLLRAAELLGIDKDKAVENAYKTPKQRMLERVSERDKVRVMEAYEGIK